MLYQRFNFIVQRAEQETAIVFHSDLFQVVGAFAVEGIRVTCVVGVLDLDQLAGVVEAPAVERTGEDGLVVLLLAAEHSATVAAGVDEAVQLAILVAGDDDGLTTDVTGEVVIRVGDLAFVRQIDPVAFKDVLHLELEQLGIGEHVATTAIKAFFFIDLHHAAHFCYQIVLHGDALLIVCLRLEGGAYAHYPASAILYPILAAGAFRSALVVV
jgi:hypothetical protein